jgi:hypothetical protein
MLSLARGWQHMDPSERQLQILLSLPITVSTIAAILLPNGVVYHRYRTPALIICRFTTIIMPSVKALMKMMMKAESALGEKWAHSRVGAIGLILFSSRALMLGVCSVATPLEFLPTLIVQVLLAASSSPTDLGLCTAKIAFAPDILRWLSGIHSFFSILWGLCIPFFWTPLPRDTVVNPGVSFLAVTFLVQLCATIIPVIHSVFRETERYQKYLASQGRPLLSSSLSRRYSITNHGGSTDLGLGNTRRNSGGGGGGESRPNSINTTFTTSIENNTSNNSIRGGGGGGGGGFFPSASVVDNKGPPLAAKLCLGYQNILYYPVHAVWLIVVTMCLMWCGSYKAAENMCTASD